MEKRRTEKKLVGTFGLTMIIVAYTITLNNFTVGASVGHGMTFSRGFLACMIGWACLSLLWVLSGIIGTKTRMDSAHIWKYVFGSTGYRIPSLVVAFCNAITAIFDYWYVGSTVSNLMPNHPNIGFVIGIIIVTGCAILGVIKGLTSLTWLTTATVPIGLGLFIAILAYTINHAGGMSTFTSYTPAEIMPFAVAVNLFVASWTPICGSYSDITVGAKTIKAVIIATPIGMLAAIFQGAVGMAGAQAFGIADITSLAVALGGALFFITSMFTIFAQGNTVPASTFIISTNFANNFKLSRTTFVFIQPLMAAACSFIVQYVADISIFTSWVSVWGILYPPVVGIMLAEFYVVQKQQFDLSEKLKPFFPAGMLTLVVGLILGAIFTYKITTVPSTLVCVVFCFVMHIVVRKCTKLR